MGAFEILRGGEDLAPQMRKRPIPLFLVGYVLMKALEGEQRRPGRRTVAEEIWPGQDPETQNERMRTLLSRIKNGGVEPAIAALIMDDGTTLGFDLDNSLVDAYQLQLLAREIEDDPELQSERLRHAASRIAGQIKGRFLEFWEELAPQVTEGRGSTDDLIRRVRDQLDEARARVLVALGRYALSRKDPTRAIAWLEEAMHVRPDLREVGLALLAAYQGAGRVQEAEDLRNSLGL